MSIPPTAPGPHDATVEEPDVSEKSWRGVAADGMSHDEIGDELTGLLRDRSRGCWSTCSGRTRS